MFPYHIVRFQATLRLREVVKAVVETPGGSVVHSATLLVAHHVPEGVAPRAAIATLTDEEKL